MSQPDWSSLRSTVDVVKEALEDLPNLEAGTFETSNICKAFCLNIPRWLDSSMAVGQKENL